MRALQSAEGTAARKRIPQMAQHGSQWLLFWICPLPAEDHELGREKNMDTQPNVASPYLTADEAALYLRTTKQGIHALVKRGRLNPMPGSRKLLFTRESLDACLQRRKN
jgi:excisionase family DNA binding protein